MLKLTELKPEDFLAAYRKLSVHPIAGRFRTINEGRPCYCPLVAICEANGLSLPDDEDVLDQIAAFLQCEQQDCWDFIRGFDSNRTDYRHFNIVNHDIAQIGFETQQYLLKEIGIKNFN